MGQFDTAIKILHAELIYHDGKSRKAKDIKLAIQKLMEPDRPNLKEPKEGKPKRKYRQIRPGQPSLDGMSIFRKAKKPLTKEEWKELFLKRFKVSSHQCGTTWFYMVGQGVIIKTGSDKYKLCDFEKKITKPGRYSISPKGEVKLISQGETSGWVYKVRRGELIENKPLPIT